ncbi:MAG: biopolymer transport protein TolR [Myxococcota bacterium]|jgi:biopolymer transport protein TolR
MGGKVRSNDGPMSDINVTPLIDVVLVLLVVFMVITPLLSSGLPVDLPMATSTTTVNDAGQFIVISVTADGRWAVEQEEVDADTLINAINAEFRARPETSILIKGDVSLEYGKVREVMDILSENRLTAVKLAAGKEK